MRLFMSSSSRWHLDRKTSFPTRLLMRRYRSVTPGVPGGMEERASPRRKADRHAKDANHVNAEAERLRIDVAFAHRPLDDLQVPKTTQEIRDIVDEEIAPFLSAATARGQGGDAAENPGGGGGVVYLHCWGGRGRAGMVAAAALAKIYGVSAEEALERVDRALKTREPEGRAPQTAVQVEFVRQFVRDL